MVRKRLYAFVRICFPSCQTTPVIEYKFNKKSRLSNRIIYAIVTHFGK